MDGNFVVRIGGICCVAVWCLLLVGCSLTVDKSLPEATIEEFEDAYNVMDIYGMVDCFDESTSASLIAGMDILLGVAGGFMGVELDGETLLQALPFLQVILGNYIDYSDFPHIDLEVQETYIKGNYATVHINELISGESIVLNMKNEDNVWKISLGLISVTSEDAERVIIAGEEQKTTNVDKELEWSFDSFDFIFEKKEEGIFINIDKILDSIFK